MIKNNSSLLGIIEVVDYLLNPNWKFIIFYSIYLLNLHIAAIHFHSVFSDVFKL